MALPDASTKLRMVLDYVPCEACLLVPVEDQDLLCGVCARLDRQIAVRVGTRTTILVERPSPSEAPVVIAPATIAEPAAPPPLREVVVRFADEPPTERAGAIEVVVEPVLPPLPAALPPPVVAEATEEGPVFDDLFEFTKARDEFFDYKRERAAAPAVAPLPEPAPEAARASDPEPIVEDDFVFRPPTEEEPLASRSFEETVVRDDIIPDEEVPVESSREEERWAPPPEPSPVEEEIFETEPVEDEPIFETEILPAEEEIVEMEMLHEEPAAGPEASGVGDLYRLRGFDGKAELALAKARIHEIAHLSGHDAGDLAERTGLPFERLVAWVQVADLVQEVGVPAEAAVALVAAGVAGPKGLRDADADEVADRASAFGGYNVNARDVKRWKRRA